MQHVWVLLCMVGELQLGWKGWGLCDRMGTYIVEVLVPIAMQ